MQQVSESTFTELLKQALDQGQVVLVSVPPQPSPPRSKAELSFVAICRQLLKLTLAVRPFRSALRVEPNPSLKLLRSSLVQSAFFGQGQQGLVYLRQYLFV